VKVIYDFGTILMESKNIIYKFQVLFPFVLIYQTITLFGETFARSTFAKKAKIRESFSE